MILQKNKFESQFLNQFKKILKLSAVRKVLETLLFQALGIIETLDSIISHGTLKKFADVRTHLRKVLKDISSPKRTFASAKVLFVSSKSKPGTYSTSFFFKRRKPPLTANKKPERMKCAVVSSPVCGNCALAGLSWKLCPTW